MSAAREPRALLTAAREFLERDDAEAIGLWPRTSALLGRRALEATVGDMWRRRDLDLRRCPMRVQLIYLRRRLGDRDLAAQTSHAWSALSRACHHHPYELAPTADELARWLGVVDEIVAAVESTR